MVLKIKKSQAALEFLTTYGWAFLVILIMIGVLAYFGILSPGKVLPSRCNFGAEFQCVDYQVSATANTFKLRLKNGVGESISVSAIALSSEGSTQYACTLTSPAALPSTLAAANISDLAFGTCNSALAGFVVGEKAKVLITVTYNTLSSGVGYAKQVKGEVYTTVI